MPVRHCGYGNPATEHDGFNEVEEHRRRGEMCPDDSGMERLIPNGETVAHTLHVESVLSEVDPRRSGGHREQRARDENEGERGIAGGAPLTGRHQVRDEHERSQLDRRRQPQEHAMREGMAAPRQFRSQIRDDHKDQHDVDLAEGQVASYRIQEQGDGKEEYQGGPPIRGGKPPAASCCNAHRDQGGKGGEVDGGPENLTGKDGKV